MNAAAQRRDPKSLLNWTERIVRMRKEVPEVGWGEFEVLPVRDPAVLAMRYDWRNNSVLFVHNLSDYAAGGRVRHRAAGPRGPGAGESTDREPQPRRPRTASTTCSSRRTRIAGTGVGGLDYLLKRSDIETPPRK